MEKCQSCSNFRQHYTFDKRRIFRVYCGHCVYPKVRKRLPDADICQYFVPADKKELPFVSKEYLSKELLQYLINLDLLPQIEDLK